jgi:hypothetical protein
LELGVHLSVGRAPDTRKGANFLERGDSQSIRGRATLIIWRVSRLYFPPSSSYARY